MAQQSKETHYLFRWDKLGDIAVGRQNLGQLVPVQIYRMLEYSLNHVLFEEFGPEKCDEIFRKAGHLAGMEYARNVLPLDASPSRFFSVLQNSLADLMVGILRVEKADFDEGEFILTVHEDLDCSGLQPTNELVCHYDEGFISGIIEVYTGRTCTVREIDCWASGERVCRFRGNFDND